jgi:hypothetical protein
MIRMLVRLTLLAILPLSALAQTADSSVWTGWTFAPGSSPNPSPAYESDTLTLDHAYTHSIAMAPKLGDPFFCMATAIGPNALLTASHCERPTKILDVDGVAVEVVATIRDEQEHTIFLLDGVTFPEWYAGSVAAMRIGEGVTYFGDPDGFPKDVLRFSYIANETVKEASFLVAGPGFMGDSGTGLWTGDGKLLGVISYAIGNTSDQVNLSMLGGYQLNFSAEDWERARQPVPQTAQPGMTISTEPGVSWKVGTPKP